MKIPAMGLVVLLIVSFSVGHYQAQQTVKELLKSNTKLTNQIIKDNQVYDFDLDSLEIIE